MYAYNLFLLEFRDPLAHKSSKQRMKKKATTTSTLQDLNLQPTVQKTVALPLSYAC